MSRSLKVAEKPKTDKAAPAVADTAAPATAASANERPPMANIQLTVTRTSPAGTVNRAKDFSDADLDRLQAAAATELRDQGIANPTNGQIVQYLFDRVVADFKSFTRAQEDRAAATARTSIGL